ncbi:MAG: ABC transporter permease subunit [Actinomyces sp.]|nr:MAG: ABC transporter permease subunit [Actinomyces sp.]
MQRLSVRGSVGAVTGVTPAVPRSPITVDELAGSPARRRRERLVGAVLFAAGAVSVVVSALIVWSLLSEAWTFITGIDWASTWGVRGWFPRRGLYDLPTIVLASIMTTGIAMMVAAPVGLGAAIYLSEYAPEGARRVLKPALEILAGIPSVVLGFFALFWLAPNIVGRITERVLVVLSVVVLATYLALVVRLAWGRFRLWQRERSRLALVETVGGSVAGLGLFALLVWWALDVIAGFEGPSRGGSLAAAGIGVGILTIPLVASVSEDAMRAVPVSLREASAGLGARKMVTTTQVVLPAAVSGIVAAFIIGISRAVGETMVVFLAGGAADAATFTNSPFDGSLTMTAAMASLASGTDNVVGEGLTFQSLYFVGLLLFVLTLVLNVVANRFVARVRDVY